MATNWLLDNGYLPEIVIRHVQKRSPTDIRSRLLTDGRICRKGIRRELQNRLNAVTGTLEEAYASKMALIESLRSRAIAENVEVANKEHYEVDTVVFEHTLGERMKFLPNCFNDP